MRARGFEEDSIWRHAFSEERTRQADALAERVRQAFAGVELAGGVGLFEAQGIDDYWERGHAKQKDEAHDWSKIPREHFEDCYSSLSFFDAPGMRFHLPAYIILELLHNYDAHSLLFTLTHERNGDYSVFSLLNPAQIQVVRDYLLFSLEDAEHEFYAKDIQRALEIIWTRERVNTGFPAPTPKLNPSRSRHSYGTKKYNRQKESRVDLEGC